MKDLMIRYNEEYKRISKIAKNTNGSIKIVEVFKKQFNETAHNLNDCIHEIARVNVFCNKNLI